MVKAFVSCSLREEDKQFIDIVEDILTKHGIQPFGTVGKYSVSPENPVETMRKNIPLADLVVIVATPRYQQKDLKTGRVTQGLSEMVHVETGMAFAMNKPVVVFVKEGTDVGTFLPNITQYVILNGHQNDLIDKYAKIYTLLNSAFQLIKQIRDKQASTGFGQLIVGALAVWGGIKIADEIFSTPKKKPTTKNTGQRKVGPRKKRS